MKRRGPAAALIALAVVVGASAALARERSALLRTEPFLAPTRSFELRDETRPVAQDVVWEQDGRGRVSVGPVRVPSKSRLEAWFGLVAPDSRSWRFVLAMTVEGETIEAATTIGAAAAGWQSLTLEAGPLAGRDATISLTAVPDGPGAPPSSPAAPDGAGAPPSSPAVPDGAGAPPSSPAVPDGAGAPPSSQAVPDGAGAPPSSQAVPDGPGAARTVVLGAPRFLVWREPQEAARNVILVSLDTLRADRLSAYGAERATTPKMDAIAARGVRFETALAPASSTPPSHMTMLTGTSPCRHGVWGVHLEDILPDEIDTLAEILGRNGYTTAAITENAYVAAPYGFARGFDSYAELKQMVADRNSPSPGVITPTGYAPRTFAAAEQWLRENASRRFLLFLHTYQVHGPRRPGRPYAELFGDTGPSGAPRSGFDPEFHDLRQYDRLVRQLDDLVGSLLEEIEDLGLAGETIVVLTSDHGEAFFEHGDHGHGWSVFGEVLRVPLVIWAPGLAQPSVVTAPAGLIDLVPTLLDLLSLPGSPDLDGLSRAAAVRDGADDVPEANSYFAETAPGNVRALRNARFKIMRASGAADDVLFDLRTDPLERAPIPLGRDGVPRGLAGDASSIAALRRELDQWADRCREQRRAADARRAQGKAAGPDPARYEKLRALGYVD